LTVGQLTTRQKEVLKVIGRLLKRHGFPPTVAEIARELKISTNGAHDHLLAMKRVGAVDWTPRKARTLRIL